LLTVGNLRKPRYWAIWMLERLEDREVRCTLTGDGAGSLVEAWASRGEGRVAIALWNGTLDQGKAEGDAALRREIALTITGLDPGPYLFRHRRLDLDHSNIHGLWETFGGDDWPDDFGWDRLRERDYLEDLEPPASIEVGHGGTVKLTFDLPMPGMSLIELDRGAFPSH
jgi:xylan 1,4-beta-xylosidase